MLADQSADPYCDVLTQQNRGQYRLWTLLRLLYFGAFFLAALSLLVISGLCTCCCRLPLALPACHRSGAGKHLQVMLDAYRSVLERVGMGWYAPKQLLLSHN